MEPEGTVEGGEEILKKFLKDTTRDWKEGKNRVTGHISLSPPIGLNVGDEGFTEDWAVIEIDATNFVGSAVGDPTLCNEDQYPRCLNMVGAE